jgi:periplasmic nitrate reductase NapE
MSKHPEPSTKTEERGVFVLLAVFLAPAIAIAGVGGLGLMIWLSQMYFGPPTG